VYGLYSKLVLKKQKNGLPTPGEIRLIKESELNSLLEFLKFTPPQIIKLRTQFYDKYLIHTNVVIENETSESDDEDSYYLELSPSKYPNKAKAVERAVEWVLSAPVVCHKNKVIVSALSQMEVQFTKDGEWAPNIYSITVEINSSWKRKAKVSILAYGETGPAPEQFIETQRMSLKN
jgi:hypothetical protein